ncbi:phage tail sheath subtilisin-like domain-containing protein [Paraburkholderia terrae]|uniref:phage tail sheath subtilisin-like domain-containing protein n=1 Tax=Paraburkholderia terrae TaxID=311230 RepID=UPI001EE29660|nr:phage tail sheath subtilisin-like domain-containing protein [Paraburkholderia terrae]GJH05034.1 phage tail sheath subtilisin-like domain-containing protein [Paraburkholderia terrae]
MSVPFANIPANNRVPFFYAEVDNSQAGYFSQTVRALLIGQKLSAGSGVSNVPQLVSRTDQAKDLFGVGSMLARMHAIYRQNDSVGEVWCIALDDPGAGVAATGSFALTGTATKAGTLSAYIGDDRVQSVVAVSDTAATAATALAAAINVNPDLPVTAAAATGTVTLTAKHKGALGNDILLQMNMLGAQGGEVTPAGLTVTVNAMSGGTAAPSLSAAVAAMGDEEYDFIIQPYADTTNLDLFRTTMNDTTGRWAWNRQIYGHVYSALRGTFAALQSAGVVRNDQHGTIAGMPTLLPNPVWEYATAYGARNAVFIAADPARPTQTGELTGITPAPASNRFIQTERQTLLSSGIATSYVSGGVVRIERAITTYQKNAWNQTDPSYLDSETMHQLAAIIRRLRNVITTKYPRHKLADDGTSFGAGAAIVTPSVIRGELASEYAAMEEEGLVENAKLFADNLIVERNSDNPNRVDILFPPDLVNQLRMVALLAQFRLQY